MEIKKAVEKPEIKIVGFDVDTSVKECQKVMKDLWCKFMAKFGEIKNKVGDVCFGYCVETSIKDCTFRYIACVEVSDFEDVPEGMVQETVPASKYVVYEHKGPVSKIGETYGVIMQELPEAGYKQKQVWLESYAVDYDPMSEDAVMEIWVSVE